MSVTLILHDHDMVLTGRDRLTLKFLTKHVVKKAAPKWHDLGLELLEDEYGENLDIIKSNYPNDVSECCKQMFQLWLQKCSNPTCDQLIKGLKEVGLNHLATTLERKPMDKVSRYSSRF